MSLWQKNKFGAPESALTAAPRCPETLIAGVGLSCVAGDQPFALLGAVGTDLSAARHDPVIKIPVPGTQNDQAVQSAPVAELEGLESPAERIERLSAKALAAAAEGLPENVAGEKLMVCTLLPGEDCARGEALNIPLLEQSLRALRPRLQTAEFRFLAATSGAVGHLVSICNELAAGDWQAVLFGGVDSLVDTVSCQELALAGRLMIAGGVQGLVPGEAAAYLALLPGAVGSARKLTRIRGASQVAEPNASKVDRLPMIGLSRAIEQTLSQASCSSGALGAVVIPFGDEISSSLEWYQTRLKNWSPQPATSESEGTVELALEAQADYEELSLTATCGDIGAATFPVSLVLGCARFDFSSPQVKNILVCAAGHEPLRGAVLLEDAAEPAGGSLAL